MWIGFGGVFVFRWVFVVAGDAFFCFCCFFLSCFSITSNILKRRSQITAANFGVLTSVNIPRIISLVSSSHRFSNNVAQTYSAVLSSVHLVMVENTCISIPTSVFGGLLVSDEVLVADGVLVFW